MTQYNWDTPVVLDFETYYDDAFRLKKLPTEQYIRSNQFEIIGVSIKVGDLPTEFYRGETGIEVIRRLIQTMPKSPFVSHNADFDFGILAFRYSLIPKLIVDTITLAKLTALDRVAGGASAQALSEWAEALGYLTITKGSYVKNMCGVRAKDMTEYDWEQYGAYCNTDTDIAYGLYRLMMQKFDNYDELLMADATLKMWLRPQIDLDAPLLQAYITRLQVEREKQLSELAKTLKLSNTDTLLKTLRSPKKFPFLLESLGVEVPTKWSEKKDKAIPATAKTDLAFLDLLEHEDELVRQVVETKLHAMSSIELTRAQSFLDLSSRGLMPISLRYASAHTGRYGGDGGVNIQNLPKRGKDLSLRRSMRAKEYFAWVACDLSAVEARLLAYVADQKDLVDTFVSGRDVYVEMAGKIYNQPYEELITEAKGNNATKAGKMKRNIGKECILGMGYSMGANRFALSMQQKGLTEASEQAERLVAIYRSSYPMIVRFWKQCSHAIDTMLAGGEFKFGGARGDLFVASGKTKFWGVTIPSIRLPNGTYIWYQNLRKDGDQYFYDQFRGKKFIKKKLFGGSLCENLVQALAFAVLKWQALELINRGVPLALNVHDEWASIVPRLKVVDTVRHYYEVMRSSPPYLSAGLLDCEVSIGFNYADLKEVKYDRQS